MSPSLKIETYKEKKISQIQSRGNDKAKCQSEWAYPLGKIKRIEVKMSELNKNLRRTISVDLNFLH